MPRIARGRVWGRAGDSTKVVLYLIKIEKLRELNKKLRKNKTKNKNKIEKNNKRIDEFKKKLKKEKAKAKARESNSDDAFVRVDSVRAGGGGPGSARTPADESDPFFDERPGAGLKILDAGIAEANENGAGGKRRSTKFSAIDA